MKKLNRYRVGELPLIYEIAERMNLRDILYEFFPTQKNEEIPIAETLMLLICNLTIAKEPLYELDEWVKKIDLGAIGLSAYRNVRFTDDRFGKVLDKLFECDRASLMTRIVIAAIQAFNINLEKICNDSTSVKAFGKYNGKTPSGLEFKKGNSKDHRPDLKQLVYSLSISQDGAVPIHHKVYSGNRNDDTTHIETWTTLTKICNRKDFIYVADCKLCTDKQLSFIAENGGKAITVIPENWKEVSEFKNKLREKKKRKKEICRRKTDNGTNYSYVFTEKCYTNNRGYRIYWILSTHKQEYDYESRQKNLKKAESELRALLPKINKQKLKTEKAIREKCDKILKHHGVSSFFKIDISQTTEEYFVRVRGNGKNEKEKRINIIYILSWNRDKKALKQERNVDGIFPLLTTDEKISAKEAFFAYKYQPKLEKRFSQFKSTHNAAPIFFKEVKRVEANMFVFFIALMLQALIEREVRSKMIEHNLKSLTVYPEGRESVYPTTSKIFDTFSSTSTYEIVENDVLQEHYQDELSEVQQKILEMLGMEHNEYWHGIAKKKKQSIL